MIHLVETLNAFGRWLIPHLGRLRLELAILAGVAHDRRASGDHCC